jgi:hypothetical protein
MNLKQIISVDSEKGMFAGVPYVAQEDGRLVRVINTEVMSGIQATNLPKTKMSALMPVLNWIAKDWKLNLSRTHDRTVAFRILRNSVIKN